MRHSALHTFGAPFLLGALSMCLLAVDSATSLEVRVVDWLDLPVAGAQVTFEREPPTGDRAVPIRADEREGGCYRFSSRDIARGRVVVRATGYASEADHWQARDGGVLEFRLQAPARIGGTVLSLDGSPIAGVHVTGSARRNCRVRENFIDDATSDADGRFLLSALRRNDWGPPALHFSAPGYVERSSSAILDDEEMEVFLVTEVDEPDVAEPDTPIDESSTAALAAPSDAISGRVIDADGLPVANARVLLGYTDESPPAELDHAITHGDDDECVVCSGLRTATDGRFCVRGLPPFSRYALLAVREARLLGSVCELDFDGENCLAQVEVVLSRAGAIRGHVVDATGGDFAHVEVSARFDSKHGDSTNDAKGGIQLWRDSGYDKGSVLFSRETSTDARGDYVFTGLEPGAYEISVNSRGHVSPIEQRLRVESGAATLAESFVFPKGHEVSGLLIDRSGQPIIGESISLFGVSGDSAATMTDRAGRFHFSGIPAGVYKTHVWRADDEWFPQRVEIPYPFELVLPKGHGVSGLLIDRAKQPIVGERIELFGISGDSAATMTDRAGRFHFSGIPAGIYDARVRRSGNAWLRQRVETPHPSELVLELPTPALLAGRVVLPNGQFADGGFGKLNRIGTPDYEDVEFDETGRFRVETRPGAYVLEVGVDEVALTSQLVQLAVGATTSMELRLVPKSSSTSETGVDRIVIRGRVTAAGHPIADASVSAVPPTSDVGDEVFDSTDAEGRYVLALPRSGMWWVQVNCYRNAGTHAPAERTLIVPAGVDEMTQDFELLLR
ncbi:MAG: hypothetical protein ACKVX7_14575 [Planctomycetota bacterium]